MRQDAIIIRKAGGGHLLPSFAPKCERGLELVARRQSEQVAVQKASGIKRHEGQSAQVAI